MENIQNVLNITAKLDEKIEFTRREIREYEKELTFLKIKNESNPGKKWFWSILEGIGWLFITLSMLLLVCGGGGDPFTIVMLFIIETPILLLTLLFRHFKSMYIVKDESMEKLATKIITLKKELEQINTEKRELINTSIPPATNTCYNEDSNQKECPMCAEIIKAKAKICRFCNYDFQQS